MYYFSFYLDIEQGLFWILHHTTKVYEHSTAFNVVDSENNELPVEVCNGACSSNFIICLN